MKKLVPVVLAAAFLLPQAALAQSSADYIPEAVRGEAFELSIRNIMRAEEKANTLPTKMTLATMMLTVPPLLIILIGPSVYGIAETLTKAGF